MPAGHRAVETAATTTRSPPARTTGSGAADVAARGTRVERGTTSPGGGSVLYPRRLRRLPPQAPRSPLGALALGYSAWAASAAGLRMAHLRAVRASFSWMR